MGFYVSLNARMNNDLMATKVPKTLRRTAFDVRCAAVLGASVR